MKGSWKSKIEDSFLRRVKLSWQLLEFKFAYYCPELLHKDWQHLKVSDEVYDKLEDEYLMLSRQLRLPPTVIEMVGFDDDTPSGRLVFSKLSKRKSDTASRWVVSELSYMVDKKNEEVYSQEDEELEELEDDFDEDLLDMF